MKLGKILTKYAYMIPSQFDGFKPWISFTKYVNHHIKLKEVVDSDSYKMTSSVLIVVTFANCIAYFISEDIIFDILDISF